MVFLCCYRFLRRSQHLEMPRETRYIADLLLAIQDNNFHDVRYIVENRLKKRERPGIPGILGCVPDKDGNYKSLNTYKELDAITLAATKREDPTILRYLVDNGANINFVCDSVSSGKKVKVSPLHVAVSNGLHNSLAILLENNADVNSVDQRGRTPLHVAVKRCDCQAMRMLLCRGAKVHVMDDTGMDPLQLASRFGHVELVRILLEYKAQIFYEGQKGPSPLHIAAMEGHVPLIDIFSHYADVNIKVRCTTDKKYKAAIHLASENGYVETVRFLLDGFGGDVNILDSDQQTPLHCALLNCHDHKRMRRKEDFDMLIEFLIQKGVNVNQLNRYGETALHLAARNQFHKAVEILLLNDADVSIKNKKDKSPRQVIPEFDLAMKQLFQRYGVLSSPYINHAMCHASSLSFSPSIATASDMHALITTDKTGKVIFTVSPKCGSNPSAPIIEHR